MTSPEASTTLFFGMSLDMMVGMALGMIASPLMMRGIKILKHKRKMTRLFNEIAQIRRNGGIDDLLYNSGNDESSLRK
jgi:hypothetical protein